MHICTPPMLLNYCGYGVNRSNQGKVGEVSSWVCSRPLPGMYTRGDKAPQNVKAKM